MHTLRIPPLALTGMNGWQATVVWSLIPEVTTWRLLAPDGQVRYLKVARLGREQSLIAERDRLIWAAAWLPVPRVLNYGNDDVWEWLLTAGMEGVNGVHDDLRGDPASLVAWLAEGLRRLHALPAAGCPFECGVDTLLRSAEQRVARGVVNPKMDFQPEHAVMTAAEALARLVRTRPSREDLVVCHGDYCPPNVLIREGRVAGYVDLGGLGVADRWWDLAVATWSMTWNFGPGWEDHFLAVYGVRRRPRKMAFYRLLHDLLP